MSNLKRWKLLKKNDGGGKAGTPKLLTLCKDSTTTLKVYHTVFDMHCAFFNLYCSARISGYQDQVIKTIANNVSEIDDPVIWW